MRISVFLALFVLAAVFPGGLAAMPGRTISGTVKDTSGAQIPDALIIVANSDGTEIARSHTDEDGTFTIKNLDAGTYAITVRSPGFRDVRQTVKVTSAAGAKVQIVMEVASIAAR